ncbi:magnesium-translocating P-type ATPase [Candidatus Profftia tarda]|uniref:Magnesium-transporting ATPase, P-type 1 n=1 Tax=Candidatus Profftia tarda TaxID=1177216 RepID=A0A8E4GI83_9ENTR|nr:magnesium-translocating P-type ATPase [Candidatus Profftia tarda]CAD6509589.1 Magnesium-transporting ATPase, P-type 1 [Candidatus Profftia tarda]
MPQLIDYSNKIWKYKNNKKDNYLRYESGFDLDETILNLSADLNGLQEEDARERLMLIGPNQVHYKTSRSIVMQFIRAFNNPFIFILILVALIILFTNYCLPITDSKEPDMIRVIMLLTMVFFSGLISFCQELRNNKTIYSLKNMVKKTAKVMRQDGLKVKKEYQNVPLHALVPGDIIFLSAGDFIPADVKLIESRNLFVNQSVLTGECIPIEKYKVATKPQKRISIKKTDKLFDRSDICMMGTNVTRGTAKAIVVVTGSRTYFGSIAKSIAGIGSKSYFDQGFNSISWLLIRFMTVIFLVVLVINVFTKGSWSEATLFALAVAIGLTPEMLPIIIGSNLTKGASKMSRHKVVVKHLNAVPKLGAMDVLCTDKTGTLTQDSIVLKYYVDIHGYESEKVLQLAWLNSYHQSGIKNLMDKAVIQFIQSHPKVKSILRFIKVDELPFDFMRRRLSIVVSNEQKMHTLICKGAVEEMLEVARYVLEQNNIVPLDKKLRDELLKIAAQYNAQGLRVLVVGIRDLGIEGSTLPLQKRDERDLVICGLLAFLDPPKASAAAAITALHKKGVVIKVLTSDNDILTLKICLDVGLDLSEPLLGYEIEKMSDEQLSLIVEKRSIFAKLAPLQKFRVLKALMGNGHTVGYLGDGIHDAPALRYADVGIAVDIGTDIAKESSDIILLEKDLMVLEKAMIIGRETFGNIIKYLNITSSANFGNVISVVVASAFIPFLPMLAIQLLLQNMMYDISQISIPCDKMDKNFLNKPCKWEAKNTSRFMLWIGPASSVFDITTYAIMWFIFTANSIEHQALFQSGWFIESLLSQMLSIHILRTNKIPFIQSSATLPVMMITGLIMVLGIYIPFSSFGSLLGLQPMPWEYFSWLLITLFSYCIFIQMIKIFYINRFRQWF